MPKSARPTPEGLCVAKRIKDKRAAAGWSQDDLAAHAGLDDKGVVVELESGRFLPPRGPGAPLRQIVEALGLNVASVLRSCYGELLRNNPHWSWCLDDPSLPLDVSLREFRHRLDTLSAAALQQVVTPFPTHRRALLDAVERAYGAYEGFVSNQPPFMFFDDQDFEAESRQLARTDSEARDYVQMMAAYRADRLARLTSPRRRHEVLIAQHGLVQFFEAMADKDRATALAEKMINAVADHLQSLTVYVLDTAGVDVDEIELVSTRPVTLSNDLLRPTTGSQFLCIFHYRAAPSEERTEYLFTMLSESTLIPAQIAKMKRLWDGARYQYISQQGDAGQDLAHAISPTSQAAATIARIRASLHQAYARQ